VSGPQFNSILTSLSTMFSMAKGFVALKTEAERQQLVIDLQQKILDAQKTIADFRDLHCGLTEDYASYRAGSVLH
jgi:hypothetical protein